MGDWSRPAASGMRLVWVTAKWPQNAESWLRKADLNRSPRLLRTAVLQRVFFCSVGRGGCTPELSRRPAAFSRPVRNGRPLLRGNCVSHNTGIRGWRSRDVSVSAQRGDINFFRERGGARRWIRQRARCCFAWRRTSASDQARSICAVTSQRVPHLSPAPRPPRASRSRYSSRLAGGSACAPADRC